MQKKKHHPTGGVFIWKGNDILIENLSMEDFKGQWKKIAFFFHRGVYAHSIIDFPSFFCYAKTSGHAMIKKATNISPEKEELGESKNEVFYRK